MSIPVSQFTNLTILLEQFNSFTKSSHFFEIALANHCFFVANNLLRTLKTKKSRSEIGLLAGFLLCIIGGFGGALISTTLTGNGIGSFLFSDDKFLIYMFSAWFLVLYAPFNLVHKLTSNFIFLVCLQ